MSVSDSGDLLRVRFAAMRVVILHSAVGDDAAKDEQDVLIQVESVSNALSVLGYDVFALPFSMDVTDIRNAVKTIRPDFAFNLVETVEQAGRLIHTAPALLDHLRLPYTGASTEAVFATSNKILAKKLLNGAGILTPPWFSLEDTRSNGISVGGTYIIKSVWEHASVGLDEDSVVAVSTSQQLLREMECRRRRLGGTCFAETYIDGREFNLSLLAGQNGPEVLPPAEIRFVHFPAGKRKVVGYRAKWETDSFEYDHTVRRFDFRREDGPLIEELGGMAKDCWRLFELRGYARVDFRVDEAGRPWVLEVNTNPCLSPDAGFFAASKQACLSYNEIIQRIVGDMDVSV